MKRFILIMMAVMLIISMTAPAAFAEEDYAGNWKSIYFNNWKDRDDEDEDEDEDDDGYNWKTAYFKDIYDYDWAWDSIIFMAKKGIVRGNGYGLYSPQRAAKEIEVLVMLIRMLGLEDEIDDHPSRYDELPDEYEGGRPANWMIPYIALAWEEGLLNEDNIDDFQPNSAASREEAAMLIITALEGDNDYNDVIEELEEWFEDGNEISGKYGWHVYKMKKWGFMIGYQRKFQPKKALSRAELAVLMYRIFNDYDFDFGYDYVTGELIDVDFNDSDDDTDDEIEIRTNGRTPKYDIHEDVKVFDGRDELTLRKLDRDYKGDTVKLKLNNDDLVVRIHVVEEDEPPVDKDEVTGTLEDFDYDNDELDWVEVDSERFSDIDEDVEIEARNLCCDVAEDEIDRFKEKHEDLRVRLYLEDDVVVKIAVYYEKLEGELQYDQNLDDDGTVDIIPEGESVKEFEFDNNIEIFINGDEVSVSEFEDFDMGEEIDYEVKASLLGNEEIICMCITYDDEVNLQGILSEFDYDGEVLDEITLEDDGDETVFGDIDEDVKILVENNCDNDAEDEIDRLNSSKHIGLEVEVVIENGDVVEILVNYEELEGELEYDPILDDNGSVDIIPEGKSSPVEYDFDDDIEFFINGDQVSESEYEDFEMDEDIEYEVEARLLANGEIIGLCIFYDD